MKLPRIPAAIVFDMDGLLFDTEALYQETALLVAAERGHNIASGIFGRMIGVPWQQSRAMLVEQLGDSFPPTSF